MDVTETIADDTNSNYIIKKVFINYVNSYHGLAIVKKIIKINEKAVADQENEERQAAELLRIKEEERFTETEMGFEGEEEGEKEENPDEKETEKLVKTLEKRVLYEIYGTLQDRDEVDIENMSNLIHTVLDPKNIHFIQIVLDCKFIIFDIGRDISQVKLAQKVLDKLEEDCKRKEINRRPSVDDKQEKRVFLLVSTIMTWMMTKKIEDAEEEEPPLNEEDYRKRRPHPCYIKHLALEKEVMNAQKRHSQYLRTLVVCPGITYGGEQDVFHYMYKMAYYGQLDIPVFKPGTNILPILYLQDFVNIIFDLIKKLPTRKIRYLLIVQPETISLTQMAELASKYIGGDDIRIKVVPKEQMFLIDPKLITQRVYNYCTFNLELSNVYYADYSFLIPGDLDSFGEKLAVEYHEARRLKPVKIIINGPPCCGKTTVSIALNNYYRVHLIKLDTLVQDEIKLLEHKIKCAEIFIEELDLLKNENVEAEEEIGEEFENSEEIQKVKDNILEWKEELNEIQTYLESLDENDDVEFSYIKKILVRRMESKPCSENQGYIIDGFPFVYKEVIEIFKNNDDEGEAEEYAEDSEITINKKIKPDLVVLLDGRDEVFCDRAMALLENDAVNTKNTEEKMLERLDKYRETTYEDVSVSNFFYDHDILPLEIKIIKCTTNEEIVQKVISIIGPPKVYAISKSEMLEMENLNAEIAEKERIKQMHLKCIREKEETERREKKLQEWTDKFIQLKYEEQEQLEARSLPLRHYLMKYILPVLTEGLLEVAKVQPDDPVDYLAEFLFKQNPDGKMLDPGYSEMTKELLLTKEFAVPVEELEGMEMCEMDSKETCSIDPLQPKKIPQTPEFTQLTSFTENMEGEQY